jgi:hypothetical protein
MVQIGSILAIALLDTGSSSTFMSVTWLYKHTAQLTYGGDWSWWQDRRPTAHWAR